MKANKNMSAMLGTCIISASAAALAVPSLAFADDGSSAGIGAIMPNMVEFIPMLVAFIILWIVLAKFGWPAFNRILEQRKSTIADSLKKSEEARVESERVLAEYKQQLNDAKKQSSLIISEAKRAGEAAKADITAQAQREADGMIEKARVAIETEKKSAISELQGSVVDISTAVASKLIDQDLSDDEHRKLIEHYVDEAGSLNAN